MQQCVGQSLSLIHILTDVDTNGIDDDNSSVISADKAKTLIQAEVTAANNIGTVDSKATVATVSQTHLDVYKRQVVYSRYKGKKMCNISRGRKHLCFHDTKYQTAEALHRSW